MGSVLKTTWSGSPCSSSQQLLLNCGKVANLNFIVYSLYLALFLEKTKSLIKLGFVVGAFFFDTKVLLAYVYLAY